MLHRRGQGQGSVGWPYGTNDIATNAWGGGGGGGEDKGKGEEEVMGVVSPPGVLPVSCHTSSHAFFANSAETLLMRLTCVTCNVGVAMWAWPMWVWQQGTG